MAGVQVPGLLALTKCYSHEELLYNISKEKDKIKD